MQRSKQLACQWSDVDHTRSHLANGSLEYVSCQSSVAEMLIFLVNQKLIAKGEVVVIDENFGVRVTEIVDPMERVSEM